MGPLDPWGFSMGGSIQQEVKKIVDNLSDAELSDILKAGQGLGGCRVFGFILRVLLGFRV